MHWEGKGVSVEIENTSSYKTFPEPKVPIPHPELPRDRDPGVRLPAGRMLPGSWNQPRLNCPLFTRNAWEVPPYPASALSRLSEEQEDLGSILPPCQGAEKGEAVGKTETLQKPCA